MGRLLFAVARAREDQSRLAARLAEATRAADQAAAARAGAERREVRADGGIVPAGLGGRGAGSALASSSVI